MNVQPEKMGGIRNEAVVSCLKVTVLSWNLTEGSLCNCLELSQSSQDWNLVYVKCKSSMLPLS